MDGDSNATSVEAWSPRLNINNPDLRKQLKQQQPLTAATSETQRCDDDHVVVINPKVGIHSVVTTPIPGPSAEVVMQFCAILYRQPEEAGLNLN